MAPVGSGSPEELRFAVDRTGPRWGLARGVAFHLIAEVDQVSLDVPVGRVHMIGRRGILAGAGDQLVEKIHGGGLGAEHGPEHVDHRRPVRFASGLDEQARGKLIRRIGRPRLPCLDHRSRGGVRPDQVEPGPGPRRDGGEIE